MGHVPEASIEDVRAAERAAREAFDSGPWPRMLPADRAQILEEISASFRRHAADLKAIVIEEAGSTTGLADTVQVEIPLSRFEYWAEAARSGPFSTPLERRAWRERGVANREVRHEPVGVVAALIPYNFPFFVAQKKLGAALAAGNTIVLKPAPTTPLMGLYIGRLLAETSLPPGVVNVVTGSQPALGVELTSSPLIDMVSFTGSSATGRAIVAQSGPTMKRLLLECGGKSACILLDDVDIEAWRPTVLGFCTHSGQGCAINTRLLVPRSRFAEVVDAITVEVAKVRVGDPWDPSSTYGPLISAAQRDRVEHHIQGGVKEGARLLVGGDRPLHLHDGYFVNPTVFVDVDNDMTIAQEEIFGPVLAVIEYDTDEDAVTIANQSRFGLSGSVWTADVGRGIAIAERIRTGSVSVNGSGGASEVDMPFGGFKQSGLGREMGPWGLMAYQELKTLSWPSGR